MTQFYHILINRHVRAVALLAVIALGTLAYVAPKVFATGNFTVSNVTFDPTTGILKFDYTGTFDNGNVAILQNGGPGINLWQGNFSSCASGTCVDQVTPGTQTSLDYGVTSVKIHDASGDVSQALDYPLPYATTNSSLSAYTSVVNGWVPNGSTWTYASADAPSFTATASGDLTGVYTPGQRIKLTQSSTTKYFLVTGASYSSPNTTITLYGGTDYTLANSTISNIYFSGQKAPVGFPLDPAKWTVTSSASTGTNQAPESTNTWYNTGGVSLAVPIGAWRVFYETYVGWETSTAGLYDAYATLSTSNNSQDDANMTGIIVASSSTLGGGTVSKEKYINLTSKTTYYLLVQTDSLSGGSLDLGSSASPPRIRATSTYL